MPARHPRPLALHPEGIILKAHLIALIVVALAALGPLVPTAAAQAPSTTATLILEQLTAAPPVVSIRGWVNASVYNQGDQDVQATVTFSWGTHGEALTGSFPNMIGPTNVPAHGRTSFNVTDWTPSPTQSGNGTIVARVSAPASLSQSSDQAQRSLSVFVERHQVTIARFGVAGADVNSRFVPEPGTEGHFQAVVFPFQVTNLGNVRDTVNVTLTNDTAPDNWTIQATNQFFTLDPGTALDGYVYLQPPSNATNVTKPQAAQIVAVSEGYRSRLPPEQRNDSTSQVVATVATGTVHPVAEDEVNFSIQQGVEADTAFVGRAATSLVTLDIKNAGNVSDVYNVSLDLTNNGTARFTVAAADPGVNGSAIQVAVLPGTTRRVTFAVHAPPDADPKDAATLAITAASVNWRAATATTTVHVQATAADLRVDSVAPAGPGPYRGVPATLVVSGANLGDLGTSGVNVSVRIFNAGEWANLTAQPLNVSAPALSPWSVTIPLNTTGLAGRYLVEARIDPEGLFPDGNRSNNVLVSNVFVHRVDLQLLPPEAIRVHPGERVSLEQGGPGFYVTNLGNADETVRLHLASTSGWFDANATQTIRQGETAAVPIAFDVPARPGASADLVRAAVSVPAEGVFEADGNATLQLVADHAPVITPDVPATTRVGESLTIAARIEATTRVARAVANVTLADGSSSILTLEPAADDADRYQATLALSSQGAINVTIEATDDASPPNTGHAGPIVVTVLPPGAPPSVTFAALSRGQAIGLGANVTVAFSGYPIASATYAVDRDAPIDLPPPFQVPTATWSAGVHTLTVEAIDVYGQHGNASIWLVKDIAPPQIQDVQVTKVADDRYHVAVRATDAATGFVVVKSSGLKAVLSSGDPLAATIDAKPGDEITVSVADAAGNVAAKTVSVGGGSFLPAPPLGVVVLAAAALALATRRRS